MLRNMLSSQKKLARRKPRVTGSTRCFNRQLAAVVLARFGEKQRPAHVGAHTLPRAAGDAAHRVVDMVAERIAGAAVAVEERREDAFGQCGREEHRVRVEPAEHDALQRFRLGTVPTPA